MSILAELKTQSLPAELANGVDAGFIPAALWIANFTRMAEASGSSRTVTIDLLRSQTEGLRTQITLFGAEPRYEAANQVRLERHVKTLLWMVGGGEFRIEGADDLLPFLQATYADGGARAFDNELIGRRVYGSDLRFISTELAGTEPPLLSSKALGGHKDGNRIGFDLGGSDRKCAALIDGEVVFSEEIPWSPYFESNPQYHIDGIADSIRRAAAHLPHVDSIGGSAAGIYVDNSPRIASLFRGVSNEDFDREIRPLFTRLQAEWNNVPFELANDGDVSALAGAATLGDNAVLGISMGTSLAVGYVDTHGHLTGWLSELAFVPVDLRDNAPVDEWSGDHGCGVQYFSQQGVQRMAADAGFSFDADLPAPLLLEQVQEHMAKGDARAQALFTAIGTRLGYSLPLYAEFYNIRHVLLLGRVLSGKGGDSIINAANAVLKRDFPALKINLVTPDESFKRHGQAVIAASLPEIQK